MTNPLIGRYIISGEIKVLTGLHIGGSKATLEIGGIDNPVIKTAKGIPYIPGSSLKGKLRSMLAWEGGSRQLKEDDTIPLLKEIFGTVNAREEKSITRIRVRDAYLKSKDFKKEFPDMEYEYTEVKIENVIDRIKGSAEHPRHSERVPAGSVFEFTIILDELKEDGEKYLNEVIRAMKHLQDSFLGGSGSRGYGAFSFQNITLSRKSVKEENGKKIYTPDSNPRTIDLES